MAQEFTLDQPINPEAVTECPSMNMTMMDLTATSSAQVCTQFSRSQKLKFQGLRCITVETSICVRHLEMVWETPFFEGYLMPYALITRPLTP